MDLYYPEDISLQAYPVIVFAHGGGFVYGNRKELRDICYYYSQRGIITASIDYRLADPNINDSTLAFKEVILATHDMKAAIRFLKSKSSEGRFSLIDTNNIFAAGLSAGAVTALHTGLLNENDSLPDYLQNLIDEEGGFEGQSNELYSSTSTVKGILSFSGALYKDFFYDEEDPNIFIVHEIMDYCIPCVFGQISIASFPIKAYGGCSIKLNSNLQGDSNSYVFFNDYGHLDYLKDYNKRKMVFCKSIDFINRISENSITGFDNNISNCNFEVTLFPNPTSGNISFSVENSTETKLFIFNVFGEKIKVIENLKYESEINLSNNFNKGIYYFVFVDENDFKIVKKVVFN